MNKNMKYKRITLLYAVIFMCMAGIMTVLFSKMNYENRTVIDDIKESTSDSVDDNEMENIIVWYSNEKYKEYLQNMADLYEKEREIHVDLVFVSAIDYLEQIYDATNLKIENKETDNSSKSNAPDVFLLDSEQLEAAYGYGLADINENTVYSELNYCDTALHAVTFHGKKVAYPLAFDTAFLIYNKKYFSNSPVTFDEIIKYSDSFNYQEHPGISKILDFNCKNLIYNYGFAGKYLNFAGVDGDDETILSLYNQEALEALAYYNGLIHKFGITKDAVEFTDYEQAFANENIVCMIGKCSSIKKIENYATENGIDYGIGLYPNLTDSFETQSLSITSTLVVNYLSEKKEQASDFAQFLTFENTDKIYEMLDLVPARRMVEADSKWNTIYSQYEKSVSLPKLMIANDYFRQLEIVLNKILEGEDIASLLNELNTVYMIRCQ